MGYIKKDDRSKIMAMHKQGFHVETIAKCLKYAASAVGNFIEGQGRIPKWRGEAWNPAYEARPVETVYEQDDPSIGYLPTEAQIRYQCELIKRKWSDRERCTRSGGLDGAMHTVETREHVETTVARKGIRGTHQ